MSETATSDTEDMMNHLYAEAMGGQRTGKGQFSWFRRRSDGRFIWQYQSCTEAGLMVSGFGSYPTWEAAYAAAGAFVVAFEQ